MPLPTVSVISCLELLLFHLAIEPNAIEDTIPQRLYFFFHLHMRLVLAILPLDVNKVQ